MASPLVSIIIPAYNSLEYLDETIASALNQTYPNIEVILVDDGSTDASRDQFSIWEKQGVTCVSQENAGAAAARNYGMKLAKGEYLQFLDADDLLVKNKIELQIKELEQLGLACHSFTQWNHFKSNLRGGKEGFKKELFTEKLVSGHVLIEKMGNCGGYIATAAWLWCKELIGETRWIKSPNDDGEFSIDLLIKDDNVIAIPQILSGYRMESLEWIKINSKDKLQLLLNSWLRIKRKIHESGKVNKGANEFIYNAIVYCLKIPNKLYPSLFFKTSFHFILMSNETEKPMLKQLKKLLRIYLMLGRK